MLHVASHSARSFLLLLAAIPLAIAVGLAGHIYGVGRVAQHTATWTPTIGLLTSQPTLVVPRYGPPGYIFVNLLYRYQVGNIEHFNSHIWSDGMLAPRAAAETLVRALSKGEHVQVYYDPERPGSSLLAPGQARGPFAPLSIWGVLAVVLPLSGAAGLVVYALRVPRSRSANGLTSA